MNVAVHLQAVTHAPVKPQPVSGESALQLLSDRISRSTDLFTLRLQVEPIDLPRLLSRIDAQKCLQCTTDNEYNLVIRRLLRLPHRSLAAGLGVELMLSMTSLHPFLTPGGTSTIKQAEGHYGQADFSLGLKCTGPAYSPAVIIQVCDLESEEQLETNARGWLESSILQVKLVILVSVGQHVLQNPRRPTLRIQNWVLDPHSKPRLAKEFDWTDGINEDYTIDTQVLWISPEIPKAMYTLDRTEQESWRGDVIKSWVAAHPE